MVRGHKQKQLKCLTQAYELDIPVFVDMAWFGTCKGIDIDPSIPIQEVAFPTTKGLCTGDYRSEYVFQDMEQ